MNIMLFLGFLTFLYGNERNQDLLEIDIRERLVNNNQIRIVIQIDNNSKRNIIEMDGFLLRIDHKGKLISEKRITFLELSDGILEPKQSISKFKIYPFNKLYPDHYEFYVAKVLLQNDYRIYTYHPAIGFYRVD